MLWKRVLTAVVAVPFLIGILLLPKAWLTAVVVLVSVIGLFEYYRAVGLSRKPALCILGYLAAITFGFGSMFTTGTNMTIGFVYVMALFCIVLAAHKTVKITDVAMLIFGLIYIPYFMMNIAYVRAIEPYGNCYVWLIFVCAFSSDTFAYTVGKLIGRHKLCPTISPKKTVEGAIGGVVGCGLSCLLYGVIMTYLVGVPVLMPRLFVLGLVVGVISEIGDLTASLIKRQFGVKDFGNILPGHGGILDRCDSIILVAPTLFLMLWNIGIVA